MQNKIHRCLFLFLVVFSFGNANAQVTIELDQPIGPTIEYFGWDLKGTVNLGNPLSRAEEHYDTGANLVRVPVFATAHFEDGSVDQSRYTNVLNSLGNILAVNPDTKVFVSLKLSGANTFPEWIESNNDGQIFGNAVKRPDPEKYSQLLTDFVEFFWNQGIKIDFFGILNEVDRAVLADEYISTVRLFQQKMIDQGIPADYRDFEWVGPDTFRVGPAAPYAQDVISMGGSDTLTIGGAHMYSLNQFENGDVWGQFANVLPAGTPLWHTEVHLNSHSAFPGISNTVLVRNAFAVLGGSARSGVTSFTWWARGDSSTDFARIMKRRAVEIMLGSQPLATTPVHPVQFNNDEPGDLFQAYRKGDRLHVVLINEGAAVPDFQVDLVGSDVVKQVLASDSWQGPGDEIGVDATELVLNPTIVNDRTAFVLDELPADSVSRFEFQLMAPDNTVSGVLRTNHSHDGVTGSNPVSPFFRTAVVQNSGETLDFAPTRGLSGSAEPGDTSTTVSGTLSFVGNSTFATCYSDGNQIPEGMELQIDVSFDLSPQAGATLAVAGGNSGNGLSISTNGLVYDAFVNGDILTVSSVSVSAALVGMALEPGVSFTTPVVDDLGFCVFRSNSFNESNEGAILIGDEGAIGFGIATGDLMSNVRIDNNHINDFLRISLLGSHVTFEAANIDANESFHLKGFGLETAFSYEFSVGAGVFVPVADVIRERGNAVGGSDAPVVNYQTDDDVTGNWNPGFTLNNTEAPVWIRFEGNVPGANEFLIESQAGTPGLSLTIEAWNYTSGSYDVLGEFSESFNSDTTATITLAANNVDSNGDVQSRVGWRQTGFTINFPWEVRIDLAGWNN